MRTIASVVIPAHNEQRTVVRCLDSLLRGVWEDELEIVVACNGCTDDTAEHARTAAPSAKVLELPLPGKDAAMRAGDKVATAFPRLHLDADVVLDGAGVRELVAAVGDGALAAAPRRVLVSEGCSWPVRWYYDVWERLPQVRDGLFGRGVVALSEEAQRRLDALPSLLSDDLAASEAFAPHERRVVDAAVVRVHPPRHLADLVRRRIRVVTGNAQADAVGARTSAAVTTWPTLLSVVARRPQLLPKLPVFLAVTAVGRLLARRAIAAGDFSTWQRDESSRG